MDSERSPSGSDAEDEPPLTARASTSRRLSASGTVPQVSGEIPGREDWSEPYKPIFEAEDVAIAIIGDAISDAVAESLETFYHERLLSFVADSVARMAFEAMAPVFATREFARERRDPLQRVVFPSATRPVERKPSRGGIDSFSKSEIPVRNWRRPSEAYYGSPTRSRHSSPSQTPRSMGKGERHDSPTASRPSSLCSFNQRKKRVNTGGHIMAAQSPVNGNPNGAAIAPGVVFSTAPPEELLRPSPRKAMALLRNAHRLSTPSPSTASPHRPREAAEGDTDTGAVAKDNDDCSTEERESNGSGGDHSSGRRRRFSIDIMNSHASEGMLQGDGESESAPVEVEYSIKRPSPGRVTSTTMLPELVAHSAAVSGSILDREGATPSEGVGETHYVVDSMTQGFHDMMLSPGVKLQAGATTKAGPELPLFVARMRKSTFYVSSRRFPFHSVTVLTLDHCSKSMRCPCQLHHRPSRSIRLNSSQRRPDDCR